MDAKCWASTILENLSLTHTPQEKPPPYVQLTKTISIQCCFVRWQRCCTVFPKWSQPTFVSNPRPSKNCDTPYSNASVNQLTLRSLSLQGIKWPLPIHEHMRMVQLMRDAYAWMISQGSEKRERERERERARDTCVSVARYIKPWCRWLRSHFRVRNRMKKKGLLYRGRVELDMHFME
jgi:hypothetical protein